MKAGSWGRLAAAIALAAVAGSAAAQAAPHCAPDDVGLTLPEGFCALLVARGIGAARQMAIAPNGDVFVAIRGAMRGNEGQTGGVMVLRDTTGDGIADVQVKIIEAERGSDVQLRIGPNQSFVYFSTFTEVIRFPWRPGSLEVGRPDTIAQDLPTSRSHNIKTFTFGPDNAMYVNFGSPSNSCQEQERQHESPGMDPCPQLATHAGIWRFDATRSHQTPADAVHFGTGMRNTVALAVHPRTGRLFGVVHGRDQLFQNWPSIYNEEQSAEKPAEELVQVNQGDDFGWPYCYFDPELGQKVLAPEYGGDGSTVGRCSDKKSPAVAFPAHWAPDGLVFYTGTQYPIKYRGGAFVAFHGSWNRAPLPQQGYNVVFVPFNGSVPTGAYEIFADGFRLSDPARYRPVDVEQGPDGSLYVSDDRAGNIFRIVYRGSR